MDVNKQTFAEYIDGELSPEAAAKVVLHLADNPEDRLYVDGLMELNEMIGQAYDQPMAEPVPPRILAVIEGRRVIAFPGFARRAAVWVATGALAAGLALVLMPPAAEVADHDFAAGVVLTEHPAAEALTRLASGESRFVGDGLSMDMVASFRAADDRYCREFRLRGASGANDGVACAAEGGWRVHALAPRPEADGGGRIAPAAGATEDPVEAALDALGAGLVLSPVEEARAMAAGWK